MGDQPARPLNDQVAELVNQLVAIAHEARREDLTELLASEARRWTDSAVTLVVAGETKRGKSALVNALLGRPGLLPVDADVATNVHVVVGYAPSEHARVHLDADVAPLDVPVGELGDWAGAAGNPDNGKGVRAVEVGVPSNLLERGLVVVDTPGVGGLDAGHARVTLAALARADALVFVLDPGAPISGPEVAFVREATRRIEEVIFVLTKTDLYRGWAEIATVDRDLLTREVPSCRSAPFVPVSSRLHEVASQLELAGVGEDAAGVLAESGLEALRAELDARVVGKGKLLRLGNLLRLSVAVAAELEGLLATMIEAASGASAAEEALRRETARLEDLKEAAGRWQTAVGDQFSLLRDQLANELNRALKRISDTYEPKLAAWAKRPAALAETVEAELRAVDIEIQTLVEHEVARIAETVSGVTGMTDLATAVTRTDDTALMWTTGAIDTSPDAAARMRLTQGVVSSLVGIGFAGMRVGTPAAGLVGTVMPLLGGMTAILGVASIAVLVRSMRTQRQVQQLRTNLRATLDATRSEMNPTFRQLLLAAQRDMEEQVKAFVRASSRELNRRATEAQQLAKADASTRQQARTSAERRLGELSELAARGRNLQAEVASRRTRRAQTAPSPTD